MCSLNKITENAQVLEEETRGPKEVNLAGVGIIADLLNKAAHACNIGALVEHGTQQQKPTSPLFQTHPTTIIERGRRRTDSLYSSDVGSARMLVSVASQYLDYLYGSTGDILDALMHLTRVEPSHRPPAIFMFTPSRGTLEGEPQTSPSRRLPPPTPTRSCRAACS